MNSVDIDNENLTGEIPQRAVSLYGQNEGVDDFPVLKAFQQYIDAEQEKSRKRILGLGIFFGAILIIVVAVFLFLLHGINIRNQALSDRLVDYAMKEADRRHATAVQQPPAQSAQNDAVLKAMTETLVSLKNKIDESENKATRPDDDSKDHEASEKILQAKALLAAEKQKLAAERERLHNIEIEQQRRRLYPELYDEDGALRYNRQRRQKASRASILTDEDIREIIREADEVSDEPETLRQTHKRKGNADKSTDADKELKTNESSSSEETDDAIEYFNDEDYTIPVDIKGTSSKVNFVVPYD